MAAGYSKRFAESATGWLNKYRLDPFFRTEVNVIALQIAFAAVIIGLVGISFDLLYHDVSLAIVQGIQASAQTQTPDAIGAAIVRDIQQIRTQNLIVIVSVVVLTTILFGYLIARITLLPARTALASQKQFIGNIAHELRTPLSVIKTNTEVALMENGSVPGLKETFESNIEELDRISEIINNLLSLSVLVSPERMEFKSVDLSALASSVVEKFAKLAKRGELEITMRKSPDTLVWGNPTALEQVVSNILKNAIRYTGTGGHISITVEPCPNDQVELIIQDSGIGIGRKDLYRIFEPFYRADPSRGRSRGGSGLGLAIVNELVKLHSGKITVRSALKRGTTVSLVLPAGKPEASRAAPKESGINEISVDFQNRSRA